MAVMAVWAAVLIAYGVSTGIAMESADPVFPLDMAPDSVDDMYNGCKDEMLTKVQNDYLQDEINTNENLKSAWNEAEKVYDQRWKPAEGVVLPSNALTKEEFIAVYIYTSASGNPHIEFNAAVRTGRSEYKTTFKYHALHFFLTIAVQKLKLDTCRTSYRGVDQYFSQDALNKEIRFGSFASSTLLGLSKAKKYGEKSCFKMLTCFGGDVSVYSKYGEAEAEVLVPPYEVFKVKNILRRSEEKSLECEVVYEVQSTKRPRSNLNCAHFSNKQ